MVEFIKVLLTLTQGVLNSLTTKQFKMKLNKRKNLTFKVGDSIG